jgi:hypothetical protein
VGLDSQGSLESIACRPHLHITCRQLVCEAATSSSDISQELTTYSVVTPCIRSSK